MLGGRRGGGWSTARRALLGTANAFAWVYEVTHDHPYRDLEGDRPPPPHGSGDALPIATADDGARAGDAPDTEAPQGDAAAHAVRRTDDGKPLWPLPKTLHPAIASVPADAERNIDALGSYIQSSESDPFLRAKAVHDWIADRIAYDVKAYRTGKYPSQDADAVFGARRGVCSGYSLLFVALAKAAGVDAVLVAGDARTEGNDVRGEGHAWNAVRIDGAYYLVDATWDAGSVDGDDFKKGFGTDYLFTPPEVFGLTHFPDQDGWQLRDHPIDRGEFFRQPMMAPAFFAAGYRLVEPDRSQVEATGSVSIRATNPRHAFFTGRVTQDGAAEATECGVTSEEDATLLCPLGDRGRYHVELFTNRARYGHYEYAGQVWVNAR
jgi:transglutaminase-like putative cysteine protease